MVADEPAQVGCVALRDEHRDEMLLHGNETGKCWNLLLNTEEVTPKISCFSPIETDIEFRPADSWGHLTGFRGYSRQLWATVVSPDPAWSQSSMQAHDQSVGTPP